MDQWRVIQAELVAPSRPMLVEFIRLGMDQAHRHRAPGFGLACDQLEAHFIDESVIRIKEKKEWPL